MPPHSYNPPRRPSDPTRALLFDLARTDCAWGKRYELFMMVIILANVRAAALRRCCDRPGPAMQPACA